MLRYDFRGFNNISRIITNIQNSNYPLYTHSAISAPLRGIFTQLEAKPTSALGACLVDYR